MITAEEAKNIVLATPDQRILDTIDRSIRYSSQVGCRECQFENAIIKHNERLHAYLEKELGYKVTRPYAGRWSIRW